MFVGIVVYLALANSQAGVGQQSGSMTPVMSTLGTEQRVMMALQETELKEEIRKFNKVPSIANTLMFSIHPDEPGAGLHLLQEVTTLVEYCKVYRMRP